MTRLYILLVTVIMVSSCKSQPQQDPWSEMTNIEARIIPPTFKDVVFNISDFGALGDGKTDCTEAFRKAIDKCSSTGGGTVLVPAGTFLTGPIHLLSKVNLHIEKGATILFSRDTKRYLPQVLTRFESIELMNYSPFIYAYDQENIAITGEGTLDGNSNEDYWWFWKKQQEANDRLKEMAKNNVPVAERIFGEGDYLRPNFIQPYQCRNVLIDGLTIKNSPMWIINPVLCTNVTVSNVTVISHGPNNDGCNPESSKDVLIENCFFDTGDDCIAIKSGRDHDGRRVNVSSENIIIRNCTMRDGHGGVVIGSEVSGNVRNVFAENCEMSSPNLERALRIKSNSRRGGIVENIYMRNVKVGDVADAVVRINMFYARETGDNHPQVRNVIVNNVTSQKSTYGLRIEGEADYPIEKVKIENCSFNNVEKGNIIKGIKGLELIENKINGKKLSQ